MGYSIEAIGSNCYPDTACLINKFDIRDDKKLAEVEAEITFDDSDHQGGRRCAG